MGKWKAARGNCARAAILIGMAERIVPRMGKKRRTLSNRFGN
jgi:hypothetical protein